MKTEAVKIIISILFIIITMLLAGMSYYEFVDTQTTIPEEIKESFSVKQEKFKERNIFIIEPAEERKINKTILYFHGGSYMAEASPKHWEFINKIVNDIGATIIMPDYPLTPKNNYKDVFEMIEPFYEKTIEQIEASNLILMGDSAGGGLTLALEEKIAEKGLPMPSRTILISPWLDVRLENPEIDKYEEKDKYLNKDSLKLAGVLYASDDGMESYLVNPIDGDLSKLKNITIFIGTNDILNPDVKLLKKKAEKQGIRRRNNYKRI